MYVISLGVGRLVLLILTWRQCEGLTAGIGAEEILPRLFIFHENLLTILFKGAEQ